MTEAKKSATTTMWQDNHNGRRGHQLMTQKLAETIPALGANENARDYDEVLATAKLFSPYNGWTWYITEMDPENGQCFGLVEGFERELGYFDLTELAETNVFGGVPAVERDLYWQPRTLGEIKRGSPGDSQHSEATRKGETMTDETGKETTPSDVVNVEEFLFGQPADDAPADVGGKLPVEEVPFGDGGDDSAADEGDATAANEQDANEEAEPEASGSDDAGEPADSPEELKVILSIKGGRATIGVQRPASDPHIESFDDPDLLGLADQFPAVVARARARWEEEPRYPAHERPAPPARRRTRREPGPPQPSTAEGEADQQQPETLRLF